MQSSSAHQPEVHALFRKKFSLAQVPACVPARIAPALGELAWAQGKVPTPHGLISVRVEPGRLQVDSPVPLIVELPGQAPRHLPAGKHDVGLSSF